MTDINTRTELERAVLSALAYYEALSKMPLSTVEIQRYLMFTDGTPRRASLSAIAKTIRSLLNMEEIKSQYGLYCLASSKTEPGNRIFRSKYTISRWRKLLRAGRFLMYTPFVRSLDLLGSVAQGNAGENSDIDIAIGVKSGRIWIARLAVTLMSHILGVRRYGSKVKDRLCFNQYLQEGEKFGPPRQATGQIEAQALHVYGKDTKNTHQLIPNPLAVGVVRLFESILEVTLLSRLLERLFYFLQIKKIKRNSVRYPSELPTPSIFSQNLIFYYPKVYETEARYKKLIKKLALHRA